MAMEQFDKWLNEDKCPHWNHREVCIAEDAWKAALEWVVKTTDEHYYAFEDKFDVIKMIKEELGNE